MAPESTYDADSSQERAGGSEPPGFTPIYIFTSNMLLLVRFYFSFQPSPEQTKVSCSTSIYPSLPAFTLNSAYCLPCPFLYLFNLHATSHSLSTTSFDAANFELQHAPPPPHTSPLPRSRSQQNKKGALGKQEYNGPTPTYVGGCRREGHARRGGHPSRWLFRARPASQGWTGGRC